MQCVFGKQADDDVLIINAIVENRRRNRCVKQKLICAETVNVIAR